MQGRKPNCRLEGKQAGKQARTPHVSKKHATAAWFTYQPHQVVHKGQADRHSGSGPYKGPTEAKALGKKQGPALELKARPVRQHDLELDIVEHRVGEHLRMATKDRHRREGSKHMMVAFQNIGW